MSTHLSYRSRSPLAGSITGAWISSQQSVSRRAGGAHTQKRVVSARFCTRTSCVCLDNLRRA